MTTYVLTVQPTKYAQRAISHEVDGIAQRNKWIKLYKKNGWRVSVRRAV